jgi:hypothetical protein
MLPACAQPAEPFGSGSEEGILVLRRGPGANCSSIGSAVEMLFLSATVGAAVLGAVMAALRPRAAEDIAAHRDEPPPPPAAREPVDPTEAG